MHCTAVYCNIMQCSPGSVPSHARVPQFVICQKGFVGKDNIKLLLYNEHTKKEKTLDTLTKKFFQYKVSCLQCYFKDFFHRAVCSVCVHHNVKDKPYFALNLTFLQQT